ncbi:hypothetical protein DZC34_10600 [Clostridium botulinum]|nr:hypothetical protein DZC34_10600 [Clostridium botulinum]
MNLYFSCWEKLGGKNKLGKKEIEYIREVYKEQRSIKKAAEITKHAKTTVNKYVSDLSIKDKRSRYNNIPVYKVDFYTGKVLRKFKNSNQASTLCRISLSNLNQCLSGKTNSAGGFCWCYGDNIKNFKLPDKIRVSYVREMDILLGIK